MTAETIHHDRKTCSSNNGTPRNTQTAASADSVSEPILDQILAMPPGLSESPQLQTGSVTGVITGTLVELDNTGQPRVDFPENPISVPVVARSTVPLTEMNVGSAVVLMFDRGCLELPIVMGVLQPSQVVAEDRKPQESVEARVLETNVDGERVVLTADQEITLRCGKASITLTKAGKILIRGAYVLNRSSGANRIKGASVQIN